MIQEELVKKNPICLLKSEITRPEDTSRMGLVMARAGLGKTAILVQIALDSLLRGEQVLHVSVGQSLDKTRLWYEDMFRDISKACNLPNSQEVHDSIMRNRMIMTFKESRLNRPKLEERLNDLVHQNVLRPKCVVVDGYDFNNVDRQVLAGLRELVEAMGIEMWFSAVSHRDDGRSSESGVPAPCHEVGDLFDTIILLEPAPQKECIDLNIVKESTGSTSGVVLKLDPITLMVKECQG